MPAFRVRTKREAEAALAELVGSVLHTGTYVSKSRQTVATFVAEWLAVIEPTVRASTHYSYARNVRLHLVLYVGGSPLAAVDAGTLNGLYARLLVDGRRNQAGGALACVTKCKSATRRRRRVAAPSASMRAPSARCASNRKR